jgi:hypothetical protein
MKSRASLGLYHSILEVFVFADNRAILGLVPVSERANIGTPGQTRTAIQQSPTFSISHFDDLYCCIYTAHQNALVIQEEFPDTPYTYNIPTNPPGFLLCCRLIHDPQWVVLFHGVRTQ